MAPSSKALAIRRTDVTREEARNVNVGLSAALGLNLTELVVERAERDPAFATRLRRALGQHASLDEATLYGSREPYPAPPRRSRRWLRDHGPELVAFGAVRIGGKRHNAEGLFRRGIDEDLLRGRARNGPAAVDVETAQFYHGMVFRRGMLTPAAHLTAQSGGAGGSVCRRRGCLGRGPSDESGRPA